MNSLKFVFLSFFRGLCFLAMNIFIFISVINLEFATAMTLTFSSPFFIVILSSLLCLKKNNLYLKYFLSSLILLPILLLLISQPDLGQTLLIAMIWLALIFVSGINIYLFFIFFIIVALTASYLIFFVPKFEYIKIRFLSFIFFLLMD